MDLTRLLQLYDESAELMAWLRSVGLKDLSRARANWWAIARSGVTPDLMAALAGQLAGRLPGLSDPDMALNNLDRFFGAARNRLALAAFFERDPDALATLLQIFSTSQYLSDLLIRDTESLDLLRLTDGQPVAREVLVAEICQDVEAVTDDRDVMAVLRRHKQRETLRIAYGDIVRRQRLDTVIEQISVLADAICEAAVRAARRKLELQRGVPRRPDGRPARFAAIAMGKLGGQELNYSSDIDLIFLCDDRGQTDGPRTIGNTEFFERMAQQVVKYLTENTSLGVAYRVDLRLRPDGRQGPPVTGVAAALRYYDVSGRTWERQALVKARPVAGDLDLAREFLDQIESWIYRRYLSWADILGIKALKRKIEQRSRREGGDQRNVKTGHGGIRDVEFVIQFLQLLNGATVPEVRTGNTLQAIDRLEKAGCLTLPERSALEENYVLLRRLEHRLQIMGDLQTHTLPERDEELRKLAIRMGYAEGPHRSALAAFKADYQQRTERNRAILDHLLHEPFASDEEAVAETDLVLEPEPSETQLQSVLGGYGFRHIQDAYRHLTALATEKIPFLSSHRCRHFLAAIARPLLQAIAATPDPDATLVDLSRVSDSLGGKGVLWELFAVHPPSLRLYVRLCAATPYLSGILTSNPGMIDELLDSLVLDKLPALAWLDRMLEDLLYGAEDIEPILHGFKNSLHLRVGVRDVLGKEDIRDTHRTLSDIAEVCLRRIAESEHRRLCGKYGVPTVASEDGSQRPCEMVVLAMGKLGGREPNYHSDLDVVFLYEADGTTQPAFRERSGQSTTNQHFFTQLAQRIIKVVSQMGPFGRLYELDARLRPTGRSGTLAVSLDEFSRYFAAGRGQLWERQALCKARPITGSAPAREAVMQAVRTAIVGHLWQPAHAEEIRRMRARLEETASRQNLKRGPGGTVDIEFAVQTLQLKYARDLPAVLQSGTLDAIEALHGAGCLSQDDSEFLSRSYRLLRRVEAHLRLMNTAARHDIPTDERELAKLAYLLDYPGVAALRSECERFTDENRRRCERLFDQAAR